MADLPAELDPVVVGQVSTEFSIPLDGSDLLDDRVLKAWTDSFTRRLSCVPR